MPETNAPDAKKMFWVKAVAAGLLILCLAGIQLANPRFFPQVWHLATSGDIGQILDFLRSFGIWAIVVSMLIDILINALGFLPSIFISTANGVLFGVVTGVIISWLAETIGVIISFLLMRTLLRDYAEKMIAKSNYLQRVDEFSGKNGFKLMLFARTLPYFPSGILTVLGAVSSISVRDYALSNLIGKFPSTALEVVIGHDVVTYQANLSRLTLVVLGVAAIYGGLWWARRQGWIKADASPKEQDDQEGSRQKDN